MTDDKLEAARDEGDHQLSNSRNIISRDEADALGLKPYFTGKPCTDALRVCGLPLGGSCATTLQAAAGGPSDRLGIERE